jgi:hypothetical protein
MFAELYREWERERERERMKPTSGRLFMAQAKTKRPPKSNPFKALMGSSLQGGGKAAKEVLEATPWFVGKTARGDVEKALEVGSPALVLCAAYGLSVA